MSSLTFEKMHIPGSHLGPDSAYPILYKQKMFEKTSILDESEGLYINYWKYPPHAALHQSGRL